MAAGAAIFSILSYGAAQAITDTKFQYKSPRVGFVSIHSMALAPDGGTSLTDGYDNNPTTGLSPHGTGCFNAGLNFPNGAKILAMRVWFANHAKVTVLRSRLFSGAQNEIFSSDLTNASGLRHAADLNVSTSASLVDNEAYSYSLQVCLSGGQGFYGARIKYSVTNAGD